MSLTTLIYDIDTGLSAIAAIICWVILILLIYADCKLSNSKSKRNRFYRISINITYCTFILLISTLIIYLIMGFNSIALYGLSWSILNASMTMFYYFAQTTLYILLLLRLHFVFCETQYRSSKCVYISFGILMSLYILFILLYICGQSIYIGHNYFDSSIFQFNAVWITDTVSAVGIEIIDLILSIFLVVIFIKKLMAVTVTLYNDQSPNKQTEDLLNDKQNDLLSMITKYFVLTFIATLSTQIESLIWSIYWIGYCLNDAGIESWTGDIFWPTLIPIDCVINVICLFLIFDFNRGWYARICNGFHVFVLGFFRTSTTRKIKRTYLESFNDVELSVTLIDS